MKVLVIGAGAVGVYFGGKLAQAGTDVTFLVREARYKLKQRGLRVYSVHGDFRVTPKVTQSIESNDNPDLVLLTVKTYHPPDVIDAIAFLASKGARVLPLLNGIGTWTFFVMLCLSAQFGAESVMSSQPWMSTGTSVKPVPCRKSGWVHYQAGNRNCAPVMDLLLWQGSPSSQGRPCGHPKVRTYFRSTYW